MEADSPGEVRKAILQTLLVPFTVGTFATHSKLRPKDILTWEWDGPVVAFGWLASTDCSSSVQVVLLSAGRFRD